MEETCNSDNNRGPKQEQRTQKRARSGVVELKIEAKSAARHKEVRSESFSEVVSTFPAYPAGSTLLHVPGERLSVAT